MAHGRSTTDFVRWPPAPTAGGEDAGFSVSFLYANTIFSERRNNVNVDPTNVTSDALGLQNVGDVALGLLLAIICFTTVIGNALVIHAVRTERKLQTVGCILVQIPSAVPQRPTYSLGAIILRHMMAA